MNLIVRHYFLPYCMMAEQGRTATETKHNNLFFVPNHKHNKTGNYNKYHKIVHKIIVAMEE